MNLVKKKLDEKDVAQGKDFNMWTQGMWHKFLELEDLTNFKATRGGDLGVDYMPPSGVDDLHTGR
ncbi:hypothetical protein ACJX0J_012894, partial [Zea mays]